MKHAAFFVAVCEGGMSMRKRYLFGKTLRKQKLSTGCVLLLIFLGIAVNLEVNLLNMASDTNLEQLKSKAGLWQTISSIVCGSVPTVLLLASNIGEYPIARYALFCLLVISWMLLCSAIYSTRRERSNYVTGLLYIGSIFLFTVIFGVVIENSEKSGNSKNPKSADTSWPSKTIINNGPVDKSRHTTIYQKLPQRTISANNVLKLKELTDKDAPIVVLYEKSKLEDTLLWRQVFEKLEQSGYTNVLLAAADPLPDDLDPGTITIKKSRSAKDRIKVIINPQQ